MDWRNLYMTQESEIKTGAKISGLMTICDTSNQSKENCSEYEEGRSDGQSFCFWYFEACNHCGNPKIQNYCLRYSKK